MGTNGFVVLKNASWPLYAQCELVNGQIVSIGCIHNPKKPNIPLEIQVSVLDVSEASKTRREVISCKNYAKQRAWYDERGNLYFRGPDLFARIKPQLPRLPLEMLPYETYFKDVFI